MKELVTKNHKFEIRTKDKEINIRTYYKDSHGMYNHMGDCLMSVKEADLFANLVSKSVHDCK